MLQPWGRRSLHPVLAEVAPFLPTLPSIQLGRAERALQDREGTKLEVWLESLFTAGKLVKVHGGDATGWGPSPRWLSGKFS